VDLSETGCCYGFGIEFTKHIFQLALQVVFIDDLYLLKRNLRTLILQYLEDFHILLGRYPLQCADVLAGLEIDAAT